jgi:hypothetical protein
MGWSSSKTGFNRATCRDQLGSPCEARTSAGCGRPAPLTADGIDELHLLYSGFTHMISLKKSYMRKAAPRLLREEPLFSPEVLACVMEVLGRTTDLRDGSDELAGSATKWVEHTLYHISPERANVVRALSSSRPLRKVLEIGAECGAVTRFLCENVNQVTSIETHMLCAAAVRSRCRDLANVNNRKLPG